MSQQAFALRSLEQGRNGPASASHLCTNHKQLGHAWESTPCVLSDPAALVCRHLEGRVDCQVLHTRQCAWMLGHSMTPQAGSSQPRHDQGRGQSSSSGMQAKFRLAAPHQKHIGAAPVSLLSHTRGDQSQAACVKAGRSTGASQAWSWQQAAPPAMDSARMCSCGVEPSRGVMVECIAACLVAQPAAVAAPHKSSTILGGSGVRLARGAMRCAAGACPVHSAGLGHNMRARAALLRICCWARAAGGRKRPFRGWSGQGQEPVLARSLLLHRLTATVERDCSPAGRGGTPETKG